MAVNPVIKTASPEDIMTPRIENWVVKANIAHILIKATHMPKKVKQSKVFMSFMLLKNPHHS